MTIFEFEKCRKKPADQRLQELDAEMHTLYCQDNDLLTEPSAPEDPAKILEALVVLAPELPLYQRLQLVKFLDKLDSLPPSGGGGLHQALMGAASHAVRFCMEEDAFVNVLLPQITGTRLVDDAEVRDTYRNAQFQYQGGGTFNRAARGIRSSSAALSTEKHAALRELRDQLILDGRGATEEDLMAASPVMISTDPVEQNVQLLQHLYENKGSLLYAGPRNAPGIPGKTLIWDTALQRRFKKLGQVDNEYIVPNPFTGGLEPKKSGSGSTRRGDNCVKEFRFAVVEHDDMRALEQQAFWASVELPIVALIHSGGKSIHAWIKVDNVTSLEQWDIEVKQKLFANFLVPMGFDAACSNAARLSRMPGHFRQDKGKIQQLLYLNPIGKRGPVL